MARPGGSPASSSRSGSSHSWLPTSSGSTPSPRSTAPSGPAASTGSTAPSDPASTVPTGVASGIGPRTDWWEHSFAHCSSGIAGRPGSQVVRDGLHLSRICGPAVRQDPRPDRHRPGHGRQGPVDLQVVVLGSRADPLGRAASGAGHMRFLSGVGSSRACFAGSRSLGSRCVPRRFWSTAPAVRVSARTDRGRPPVRWPLCARPRRRPGPSAGRSRRHRRRWQHPPAPCRSRSRVGQGPLPAL